ncbi:MAG: ATP-binding region ATPase domain protein [Gemmatimonadetes bacterium]|nr:ATP-binding region ATPase domain protein [Gemmatimonadota bacterium]
MPESTPSGGEDVSSPSSDARPILGTRWWIPSAFAILSLVLLLVVPALIDYRITKVRRELTQGSERARVLLNDLEAAFASQLLARHDPQASGNPPEFALPRHLQADQAELSAAMGGMAPHTLAQYDSLTIRLRAWNQARHDAPATSAQQGLELLASAERLDSALALETQTHRAEVDRLERYFVLTPSVLAPMALLAILIVILSGRRLRAFARLAEEERSAVVHASEARAALLRGVTHDVKNPLGAAAGYAEILESGMAGELAPEQLKMVRRIQSLVHTAVETVSDLLELARAESTLHLEYAAGDLASIVREVVDDHDGLARARSIDVTVRAMPTPLVTDALRVRQILMNLLTNALKYSPESSRVQLSIVRDETDGGPAERIGVEVRDSGPGVPSELRAQVFQEFFRVRGGDSDVPDGNGLGLAISRRLARLLGGDIALSNVPSGGASFTLWLPSSVEHRDVLPLR